MDRLSRRSFVHLGLASLAACALPRQGRVLGPDRPRPTPAQLRWQRDELAMFLHFGVNTFTDREWGDGREDPSIFAPSALDAMQWARTARDAGFKAVVLTAKHHDGFCLWPTATTTHSVASSPWRGGTGDLVREFADACRSAGLRSGLYLSPWDRNHPAYGDSPRYNDVYVAQLTELLTRYGPIAEVWFDGANGEGPNGKRQLYDWPRIWGTVRRLQPEAVIFSDAGPDVRWCGNERGTAGDPNWSTVDPIAVPYPGADGPGIVDALQHGDPAGTVWRPAEVDVSIRPGWFYHSAEDARVRPVDDLVELYFTSVGRNGKLLLNVPPTRDGVLHAVDVARLTKFREARQRLFDEDVAIDAHRKELPNGSLTYTLPREQSIGVVRLGEDIERGQRVSRFTVEGAGGSGPWRTLANGTTIGYARLLRFDPTMLTRVRVRVDEALGANASISAQLFTG
jgi:alpha-L-fucosidase